MNKKLKTIGSVFMATCLMLTMSSTSLCAVVADAIEVKNAKTEAVIQEASEDLTTADNQENALTTANDQEDASEEPTAEDNKEEASEALTTSDEPTLCYTKDEDLYDTSWYDSTKDTFEISNAKELAGLAVLTSGSKGYDEVNFSGKTILITNDINLDEDTLELFPMSRGSSYFEGTFDGQNHTITRATTIGSVSQMNGGLFSKTNNATIKNVILAGYVYGSSQAGGMIGYAKNSTIENCTNKATITASNYIGGIASESFNSIVKNCINEGKFIGEEGCEFTGGIVGFSYYGKILNSYNKGSITLNNASSIRYIGGIVGKIEQATVANCYNLCDISNTNVSKSAGLVAMSESGNIDNCYNMGNIASGDQIIGQSDGGTVTNCYYLGSGEDNAKTKEEFENGTVAKLLNANAKNNNEYSLWKVDTNKITTFASYELLFNINLSNAKVVLKNSAGDIIESTTNGEYSKDLLTLGETYTYEVSADNYKTETGEFTCDGEPKVIKVDLVKLYDISWYNSTKDTFEISNAKELAGLAALVNGKEGTAVNFSGKTILITNDIEVNDETLNSLLPIGNSSSKAFKGTFNGQNHTITVDINSSESVTGLFGYIEDATVENLTVAGSIISADKAGGITSTATNSTIENCTNKATIQSKKYNSGGIASDISNSTINNCENTGDLTLIDESGVLAYPAMTGGIVRYASDESKITNCKNKGNITTASAFIGGIVGSLENNSSIDNCANEGKLTATQSYGDNDETIGGIVGYFHYASSITNSYNKGNIVSKRSSRNDFSAGLVGEAVIRSSNGTIANCYNLGNISCENSNEYKAGLIGYISLTYITLDNCYNLGDVGSGSQIVADSDGATFTNCYYLGSGEDSAKTKEEFENGTVAKLLNTNVTSSNGYSLWKVDENKITTFSNCELVFNTNPSDAKVVLKNSVGETIESTAESTANAEYSKDSLTSGETYTYEVSANGYEAVTGEFTYNGGKTAIRVELTEKAIETVDVTFETGNEDDKIVKSVEAGETLDFTPDSPTKEGYIFVGWYKDTDDITTEYKNGQTYEENTTYKAKWAHVSMLGAQVKSIANNKSGIRFGTKLYNDGDEVVEKGTIILPVNLLKEGEALTLETSKIAKAVANVNYQENEEENYVVYLGTIVNIPSTQFDRQITASAYVIYKDKAGNNYTVYAPYQEGSTSVNELLGK